MLEKIFGSLDQSNTTEKAKHFANSRIQRYTDSAIYPFSDKAVVFIDLNKGTGSRLGLVDW